jgi:hypothetical protein
LASLQLLYYWCRLFPPRGLSLISFSVSRRLLLDEQIALGIQWYRRRRAALVSKQVIVPVRKFITAEKRWRDSLQIELLTYCFRAALELADCTSDWIVLITLLNRAGNASYAHPVICSITFMSPPAVYAWIWSRC